MGPKTKAGAAQAVFDSSSTKGGLDWQHVRSHAGCRLLAFVALSHCVTDRHVGGVSAHLAPAASF